MSIKDEIERIGNNVSDALAAAAEMGATVPDGANSDDLGSLIRSIPTGGGGAGAPMWIYAYGQSYNSLKVTTKDGYESDFEVDNLFEISRQRPIFLKTQVINVVAGKNVTGYFGYKGDALFHGFYYDFDGNRVPATAEMSVNASNEIKQVAITDEKWAGSSVDLNITSGESGGGGTSIDVTASVGQTIVVKEVDANGKPTAWEAVDYQPRTHWSETGTATIMPETTVEIDPENGDGMALVDFALEPNKPYTIKYNGVEYPDCVGVDLGEMGLGFGNLGALNESLPVTDHPFVLVFATFDIDEDGNTDYLIGVYPLDGSESVTLSIEGEVETTHKIPEKYVPTLEEMHSEEIVLLPETTFDVDPVEHTAILPLLNLQEGDICTINLNGEIHVIECKASDNALVCTDPNGLFYFGTTYEDATPFSVFYGAYTNITLSVVAKRVKTIPSEYLSKDGFPTVIFEGTLFGGAVLRFSKPLQTIIDAVDAKKNVILSIKDESSFTNVQYPFNRTTGDGKYIFENVGYDDNVGKYWVDVQKITLYEGEATYSAHTFDLQLH